MPVEGVDGYPLYWPEGWTRTQPLRRRAAPYKVHFVQARDELVHSLELMRARAICISTNIPLRRDGLPLANIAEPQDTGVAVYWTTQTGQLLNGKPEAVTRVIACDKWTRTRDNLRALGLAIEALRALERSGASQVLDRAFLGFTALPAHAGGTIVRPWREVLGCATPNPSVVDVEALYRLKVQAAHPDRGGSHEQMVELNRAHDQALQELGR